MNMKRATVQFQIEASIEIQVPMGASLAKIDQIAQATVRKEAGALSADLAGWSVTWVSIARLMEEEMRKKLATEIARKTVVASVASSVGLATVATTSTKGKKNENDICLAASWCR